MKVGILNAIHPETSTVDWQGTPVDAYIRFFQRLNAPFTYVGYEVAQGQFPLSPDACAAYVITGSMNGTYEPDEWIARLAQFIRDSYQAGKKLVGICFGHQILAHALGGYSEKSDKGWGFGVKTIDLLESKAWMTDKPAQCSLYFAHQDQVTQLPPGAELLGGNAFCPNAFFAIEDRVLGVQGHPEFTPAIMQGLSSEIGAKMNKEGYETAVVSINKQTPDNQLVGQWIVNFLSADETGGE